ncbi:uncharacterized protein LOC133365529 isoform X1 [Rhineura floridana]|uniref:uncharacterized protein LOC133365529 isoform X1 n=1 Tax=Rhineura floridana TaxID=261503 RepID=UPI002AC7F372|nr:uncharacterized protein LOC133365529 isoform X1 [Rhineura floridana]
MRKLWLILATLLAFVAFAVGQNRILTKPRARRWFCPGCYTPLFQSDSETGATSVEDSILSPVEPSKQNKTLGRLLPRWQPCPGCFPAMDLTADHTINVTLVEDSILSPVELSKRNRTWARRRPPPRRKPCPGCWTVMRPWLDHTINVTLAEDSILSAVEPSKRNRTSARRPPGRASVHEERIVILPPVGSRSNIRTKRDAPWRRRGKLRTSTRAMCRGCYSGLTIVAPPAQDSKNQTLIGSHSESDGDSSEED